MQRPAPSHRVEAFSDAFFAIVAKRLLPTVTRRDRRRISRTYLAALVPYVLAFAPAGSRRFAGVGFILALALFFAIVDRLRGFASEDIAANPDAASD